MSKRLILKKLQFQETNEGGCPNDILSRKGAIISNETDEERTCLLGGGAGRSSDRSSYRGIERGYFAFNTVFSNLKYNCPSHPLVQSTKSVWI